MIGNMVTPGPKRLESIQALRGIAALLVLFFHLAAFQKQMAEGNPSDISLTSGIWDNGWAGVDLFFVISGFIMVYVTQNRGRTLRDVGQFVFSRVTRIYPLWWVCAGIMSLYFLLTYGMPAAPDRVANSSEAITYAIKSFLLLPQSSEPMLGLGWTLIHEMFFYIVFACMLFLPRKYLMAALICWVVFTVIGSQFIRPAAFGRTFAELAVSPYSLEFIAGGFAGYFISTHRIFMPIAIMSVGFVSAVLALLLFPYDGEASYTIRRVAIFTLPFMCLVYGAAGSEMRDQLKTPQWLSRLGDWSFSLYLTHYIVLVTLRRIYRLFFPENLWVGALGVWDNVIFALLALTLSIVTASVFYNLIERPSLKFFRRKKLKIRSP